MYGIENTDYVELVLWFLLLWGAMYASSPRSLDRFERKLAREKKPIQGRIHK